MTNQVFFEEDVRVFIQVDTKCPEDALPPLFNRFILKRNKYRNIILTVNLLEYLSTLTRQHQIYNSILFTTDSKTYLCDWGQDPADVGPCRASFLLEHFDELTSVLVKLCVELGDKGTSSDPHKFCFHLKTTCPQKYFILLLPI